MSSDSITPREVVHHQADLILRFRDYRFQKYVSFALAAGIRNRDGNRIERNHQHEAMMHTVKNGLDTAETFLVTDDMSLLVQAAAASLDESDTWDHTLAPTSSGLVYFARPLPMRDMRGVSLKIHTITWTQTGNATLLTFWNDCVRDPDMATEAVGEMEGGRVLRLIGPHGWIAGYVGRDGEQLGPPQVTPPASFILELEKAEGATPQAFDNTARLVHALWLLLDQTIVATEQTATPKQTLKHFRRMRIPPMITTIKLRRIKGIPHEGETNVEWSHRWMVRGHWRWQACGTNRAERKRIWVHGYVKGPEDKPLIVTKHVNVLAR